VDKKDLGRNDPCHCGSGRKYKQCCLAKDEAAEREARAKAGGAEAAAPAESPHVPPGTAPRQKTHQPWKRGGQANTRGFQRVNATRKVGGG
jgi:hypothetical protein